ncbi:MAG: YciE/YciF ferroxidase family protein [Flavitalea sp.]
MPRQTTKTKKSATSSGKTAASSKSPNTNAYKNSTSTAAQQNSMLEKFVIDMLKDIYYAEKHLLKTMPKMMKAATSDSLKQAFADHIEVTKEQIVRLEQAFEIMGKKAQAKKCDAMDGLISESMSVIEDTEKGTMTRDVALIVAAQKAEHYEIASYGSLVQLARTMGQDEIADLLEQTLQEEKDTDQLLTQIAENDINLQAEEEEEEG